MCRQIILGSQSPIRQVGEPQIVHSKTARQNNVVWFWFEPIIKSSLKMFQVAFLLFDTILQVAIKNKSSQEDMLLVIYIISDIKFN